MDYQDAHLDKAVGGEALAVKAFELPPDQSVCPYEYEEEWLLVLDGAVLVRTPQGEQELTAGEIVCFAPGPSGTHKVNYRLERNAITRSTIGPAVRPIRSTLLDYRQGFPRPPRIAPGSGLIIVSITPESGLGTLGVDGAGFGGIKIMLARAATPTKGPRR